VKTPTLLRLADSSVRRGLIAAVRLYQLALSPLLGGRCRFRPSCSEYFIEAVKKRGPVRGAVMGLWRILRCNPLSKGGYDPVATDAGR